MLMKMIQSSLEIAFIPIRKVVIMFHLMLRNRFDSGLPITVKEVDDLKNNIILASMLQAETVGTPRILIEDPNPVEAFYVIARSSVETAQYQRLQPGAVHRSRLAQGSPDGVQP